MKRDQVTIVGGGKGGEALLSTLLDIGEVEVCCVIDISRDAPAMTLAAKHGIATRCDTDFAFLADNDDVDLILEVTGQDDVFTRLQSIKHRDCKLIGSKGSRIIFSLLEAQQRARHELDVYKDSLEQKVTERTEEVEEINSQLRDSIEEQKLLNQQLKRINREKTKYLLRSTHQLKAPFAAIQSYMDLIVDGYTGQVPEQTIHVATKVQARCEFLSHSIKQMLQIANLKSFVSDNLEVESCDISTILSSMLEDSYAELGRNSGITLQLTCHDKICMTRGNRNQLIIMFASLLDNAIHYSTTDTMVDISVMATDRHVVVTITDQGIGIREDAIDKVFNEYYRTNEGLKKHPDGTGLGLTIAKEIATIHGATLTISSKQNQGTIVTITMDLLAD